MTRGRQDLALGIVFFAGLGILLWATFTLSGFTLQPPDEHDIYFDNAVGLRDGDPVFVLGHRVGQVKGIQYLRDGQPPNRVRIVVTLDSPVTFRDDYRISIQEGNLLGGKLIEIDPGTSSNLAPAEFALKGTIKPSGIAALGDLLGDPEVKADFKRIVSGIREAVDQINSNESTIGKLFRESVLYDDLAAAVQSLRRSIEEVERGTGGLGRFIYDQKVGDDVASITDRVNSVVTKIDEGPGLLGTLVNDAEMGEDARKLIADAGDLLADARAGKGTVGLLFKDEETESRVRSAVADFATVADNLANASEEIRYGSGIANRVIYDPDMGDQLERILNQVSRAIEDAREAAPVGSFFSVISGAF